MLDLVFSDIHADMGGLQTILDVTLSPDFEDRYGKVSRIINLGDLLERGTGPKQVLQKMTELSGSYRMISVMGNHDEGFLYQREISGSSTASALAHGSLSQQDLEFFRENGDGTFGDQFVVEKNDRLFCVHGGPLDPDRIQKNGEDPWLYQRTWQRLSDQETEFYSYFGYHYKPSSAFREGKEHLENFVMLCGHQHVEAAIREERGKITNIWTFDHTLEKMSSHVLKKREFPIDKRANYLFRMGLGGPQGHHTGGFAKPHFAIIQDEPRKLIMFTVEVQR